MRCIFKGSALEHRGSTSSCAARIWTFQTEALRLNASSPRSSLLPAGREIEHTARRFPDFAGQPPGRAVRPATGSALCPNRWVNTLGVAVTVSTRRRVDCDSRCEASPGRCCRLPTRPPSSGRGFACSGCCPGRCSLRSGSARAQSPCANCRVDSGLLEACRGLCPASVHSLAFELPVLDTHDDRVSSHLHRYRAVSGFAQRFACGLRGVVPDCSVSFRWLFDLSLSRILVGSLTCSPSCNCCFQVVSAERVYRDGCCQRVCVCSHRQVVQVAHRRSQAAVYELCRQDLAGGQNRCLPCFQGFSLVSTAWRRRASTSSIRPMVPNSIVGVASRSMCVAPAPWSLRHSSGFFLRPRCSRSVSGWTCMSRS